MALSLGFFILSMALSLFSSMAKLAFDLHQEIIAGTHLEKSVRWINYFIHSSDTVRLINNPQEIRQLGLTQSGRVKYVGSGGVLELSSDISAQTPVNTSKNKKNYHWIYHCEAGLCLDDNKNNKRQVLVSGITKFKINLSALSSQSPQKFNFYLAEKTMHLQWSEYT